MYERYSRFQSLRNQLFFLEETLHSLWVGSLSPPGNRHVSLKNTRLVAF